MNSNSKNISCRLESLDNELIYSNLGSDCLFCIRSCTESSEINNACIKSEKRRRGAAKCQSGRVFICSDIIDNIKSSKIFKRTFDFYIVMLKEYRLIKDDLEKKQLEKTDRLLHNLVSLNAYLIQDLYALISQDLLTSARNYREQRDLTARKINANPDEAADTFLKVLKTGVSVKIEFSAFRKLNDRNPLLRFASHGLHKVLLNVTNLFLSAFADKQVNLIIDSTTGKVQIDYESVHVAFYHLLDNAVKYIKHGTNLHISFRQAEKEIDVIMRMTSVGIGKNELAMIFEDNYSGEYVRQLGQEGKGLGMGIVRDLLKLNGARIVIEPGDVFANQSEKKSADILYSDNCFIITFNSV